MRAPDPTHTVDSRAVDLNTRDRWIIAGPLLIVAAGALCYANSLSNGFIFDDGLRIVDNVHLRRLWPPWDLLKESRRPVVALTLAMNYAVGGLDPRGYHLANAVIHILAGLTLFHILRRTLQMKALPERFTAAATKTALSVAVLWVVHPLQTQSVTYLIQRAESLMGLFYLLTLYCLVRGNTSGRPFLWYCGVVCAAALGMGSKAVMVTAPLVLLCYDRLFLSNSFRETWHRRGGLYVALASTWSVLWISGVAPGVLNPSAAHANVGFGFKGITPLTYACTQPGVILHYLRLSLWPHPLCIDYDWPPAENLGDVLLPGLVILALILAILWALRYMPPLAFAGIWFFGVLAPTSSFIPIKDAAFEHRMYLPLASVVALVVLGGYNAWMRVRASLSRWPRINALGPKAAVTMVALVLGVLTAHRNLDYASDVTMWRDVVAKRPTNHRARNNLATRLMTDGRLNEAIDQLREAVRLDPESRTAYANLGVAFRAQGRHTEAVEALQRAVELQPRDKRAYYHLGSSLRTLDRLEEARKTLLEALRIDPQYARVYYELGQLFLDRGELGTAVKGFQFAVQFDPPFAEAHYRLGQTLSRMGRTAEAITAYRKVLDLDTTHMAARRALNIIVSPLPPD